MEDLLGEDWKSPAQPTPSTTQSNPAIFAASYGSFRASPQLPQSGLSSSQVSRPSSTVNGAPKPTGNDAFGNILSLKSQKNGNNLSLQEQQKRMLEDRRKQQAQQSHLWDSLGSGASTPDIRRPSPSIQEDEDDILAAFNKDAPVNRASHFAPPSSSRAQSGTNTPALSEAVRTVDEDDDPFDLDQVSGKSNGDVTATKRPVDDEEDILGALGKPMEESRIEPRITPKEAEVGSNEGVSARAGLGSSAKDDRALAELVDMGFPEDTAGLALAETGGDVQNAVGWLLRQAHEESKQNARDRGENRRASQSGSSRSPPRRRAQDREATPAWMRNGDRPTSSGQQNGRTTANGERDASQAAQEFGNKLFKTAGSLWKASQKQMARTMAEFQQDVPFDPSQPKWMRGAVVEEGQTTSRSRPNATRVTAAAPAQQLDVTDEAAMLDAPRARHLNSQRATPPSQSTDLPSIRRPPNEQLSQKVSSSQTFPAQPEQKQTGRLSRQAVEDQSSQAYISPARRKRVTPSADPIKSSEVDLFSSATSLAASAPSSSTSKSMQPKPTKPSPTTRPAQVSRKAEPPPRNIPGVSSTALNTSASHRKNGGEHFKRGDYAAAHESYTAALNPIPSDHPIAIVILCNRSLTALKTGDAKVAVSDANRALDIIGSGCGSGESIELGPGEGSKDMRDFYGKALMRKAEALEHMEKYTDAVAVWREAIAAGVGGAVSLSGRDRCEKAAAPKPAAVNLTPRPTAKGAKQPPPAKSLGNSLQRPSIASPVSSEAVSKLRQANADAERADDEKFALSDSVEAKLTAWKGSKSDNLRALLQSMEVVLWPEAGWKKVGMSDLVIPSKVKIVYMKAIGKVHPDKVCLGICDFVIETSTDKSYSDTPGCHDRTTYDQCCCLQHFE